MESDPDKLVYFDALCVSLSARMHIQLEEVLLNTSSGVSFTAIHALHVDNLFVSVMMLTIACEHSALAVGNGVRFWQRRVK